jgi:hypothetical protein
VRHSSAVPSQRDALRYVIWRGSDRLVHCVYLLLWFDEEATVQCGQAILDPIEARLSQNYDYYLYMVIYHILVVHRDIGLPWVGPIDEGYSSIFGVVMEIVDCVSFEVIMRCDSLFAYTNSHSGTHMS